MPLDLNRFLDTDTACPLSHLLPSSVPAPAVAADRRRRGQLQGAGAGYAAAGAHQAPGVACARYDSYAFFCPSHLAHDGYGNFACTFHQFPKPGLPFPPPS